MIVAGSGEDCEVVGENRIVEDDGGPCGAQTFQPFHERFARFWSKRNQRCLGLFPDLGRSRRRRIALKWNA